MRDPRTKILSLDQALRWRNDLRAAGRRLVMTNGCFDLLHRGHVEYLNASRRLGDALLVALNTDASVRAIKGPLRPVIPEADRAYLVASLECCDAVILFGAAEATDARPLIERLRPDVYAKGGDYTLDTIHAGERELLLRLGIRIEFVRLVPGLSTTDLIRRVTRLADSHSR